MGQRQPGPTWLWRRIRQILHWLNTPYISTETNICAYQQNTVQSITVCFLWTNTCMHVHIFSPLKIFFSRSCLISSYSKSLLFHYIYHYTTPVCTKCAGSIAPAEWVLPRWWRWKVRNRMLFLINEICCCSFQFSAKSYEFFQSYVFRLVEIETTCSLNDKEK